MSWWSSSGWTDLASQAIKNAQHKIDKVLDIKDEDRDSQVSLERPETQSKTKKDDSSSEFWNSWLPSTSETSTSEETKSTTSNTRYIKNESLETDESLIPPVQPTDKIEKENDVLSRKLSDERQKSKSKSSPRSPKKAVISPKSQETSGGWGFSWDTMKDEHISSDSWDSFNSLSANKSETSAISETNDDILEERLIEISDDQKPVETHVSDNFQTVTEIENVAEIVKTDEHQVKQTVIQTSELCDIVAQPGDNIQTEHQNETESVFQIVENVSANEIYTICETNPDYSSTVESFTTENTTTKVTDDEILEITKPDLNLTAEQTDILSASDTTILTLSGTDDYQQASLGVDNQQVCDEINHQQVCDDVNHQQNTVSINYQQTAFSTGDNQKTSHSTEQEKVCLDTDQQISFGVDDYQQTSSSTYEQIYFGTDNYQPTFLGTDNQQPNLGTNYQQLSITTGKKLTSRNENSESQQDKLHQSEDNIEDAGKYISEDKDISIECDINTNIDSNTDSATSTTLKQTLDDSEGKDENINLLQCSEDNNLLQSSEDNNLLQSSEDNNLLQSSESLGGSFVKCMIEEAMADMSKPDDSGSDNHSNGEKSESSKFESEIDKSVSGHNSSDEIETTTSSDIEIISAPTPNDEYKLMDLSPLKLALQKTVQRGYSSHRRTDSQSSSSTYSKAGESDQLSPGRDSLERQDIDSGDDCDLEHHRRMSHDDLKHRAPELSVVSEESSNPYQTGRLLKKLAEMAEVLQARENKLVHLSKENNDLLESNSILRNQLGQLESAHEAKMEDVDSLGEEFKHRITEGERKLNAVIREKDNVKKQLKSVQDELHRKISDRTQQKLMEEKDEQNKELLAEGEKLSKQQLQSNNIIKKLRVKEKENDDLVTIQKSKIEDMTKELEHLRKVCDCKADLEKKQIDAINQLNFAVQKQEKELMRHRSDEEDFQEKTRSLQTALDNSYKEIADLHKTNAAKDSKASEMAQSLQLQIREEAQFAMNKELIKAKQEKEMLIMQIEDLRISMARMEKEHNRKEDLLRQDISDLQFQLQADEQRNQELSQNVSSTTRPLLRQIQNLQASYKSQSTSFERLEKTFTDRLTDTQNQLAVAMDKERTANEKLMDITSEITSLETQNTRLKQEKTQFIVQNGLDKTKIEMLEDAKQNETAHIEAIKNQMTKEITELKRDKVFLESQIEIEKTKLESEKRRCAVVEEQLKILERETPRSRGTPSPISVSRQESIISFTDQPPSLSSLPQDDIPERSLFMTTPPNNSKTLYEQLRHTGATALIEALESQLKLREGEITHLQSEISQLERTRESMAKELVNLTNQNDELEDRLKEYPELVNSYKELDGRYNAILQMYGEKVEETQELKLDLQDVKEMYKQQINHLLTK